MGTCKIELTAKEVVILQEALYELECNSETFREDVADLTCQFERLLEQIPASAIV